MKNLILILVLTPLFSFGQKDFWLPMDEDDTYGYPVNQFRPEYRFGWLPKEDTIRHTQALSAYACYPGTDFGIAATYNRHQLTREFWGRRYNLRTHFAFGFLYYPHREEKDFQIANAISLGFGEYYTKDPGLYPDTITSYIGGGASEIFLKDTRSLRFCNLRFFESLVYRQTLFLQYTHDLFIQKESFHQHIQIEALVRHYGLKGGLYYDSYRGAGPLLRYRINVYQKAIGFEISFTTLFDEIGPPSLLQASLVLSAF